MSKTKTNAPSRREKKPYRLNMSMSFWAHRKLRVMAAEGMVSMAATIEAALLGFDGLNDEERDALYELAHELRATEKATS